MITKTRPLRPAHPLRKELIRPLIRTTRLPNLDGLEKGTRNHSNDPVNERIRIPSTSLFTRPILLLIPPQLLNSRVNHRVLEQIPNNPPIALGI